MVETQAQQNPITPDLTINDILQKYPEVIPILMEHGIHCIGCHVAAFETLGQGLAGHGMSKEQISKIISELNQAVREKQAKEKTNPKMSDTEEKN